MVRGAAGTGRARRRVCADGRATGRVLVRASLVVEENVFAFAHAWLRQDATSTTRLAEPVTAAFATTEDAPVFAAAETLSNARLAAIVAAWDAARNDERAEHAAFRARGAKRSEAFVLEDLLAPELRDALRDGSPAALAPLLGGQGRVRTLQVLTRPAAEAVAGALDRARGTTESRPTNNMSYATSDVGVVVPRTADGPASLLVDEAGWRSIRRSGGNVVAPLARSCSRRSRRRTRAAGLGPQAVSRPAPHHKRDGVAPQRRLRN